MTLTARRGLSANKIALRTDIHDGPEHMLQSETEYIKTYFISSADGSDRQGACYFSGVISGLIGASEETRAPSSDLDETASRFLGAERGDRQ